MTAPNPSAAPLPPWYARSGIILSLLALLVLASALLVRTPVTGRQGDPRLSTYSTAPLGAKLFYEVAEKLGWKVERSTSEKFSGTPNTILAVLDPIVALRPPDVHEILEHVRRGGALIVALGNGTDALSDSIGIAFEGPGGNTITGRGHLEPCSTRVRFSRNGLWFGEPTLFTLNDKRIAAPAAEPFVFVRVQGSRRNPTASRPAVVGIPFGAGRIVVASDPDVFRNDALRDCAYGFDVALVRELEYLSAGASSSRRRIAFDEFHQGRGERQGTIGAVQKYLRDAPSGHAVLQIALAGLLLLLALGARTLPPRSDVRLQRRSPLEHVDALARAYAQVRATRTAVKHLVSGLRRRVDRGVGRTPDADELFLARIVQAKPALEPDVIIVRRALESSVNEKEFKEVGEAIGRLEVALTQT